MPKMFHSPSHIFRDKLLQNYIFHLENSLYAELLTNLSIIGTYIKNRPRRHIVGIVPKIKNAKNILRPFPRFLDKLLQRYIFHLENSKYADF